MKYIRINTLVVNPVWEGTGLKIKSVEAIAQGKLLVSTSTGVEGFVAEGKEPFISTNSIEDMANRIAECLENKELIKKYEEMAQKYRERSLMPNSIYKKLTELLIKEDSVKTKNMAKGQI